MYIGRTLWVGQVVPAELPAVEVGRVYILAFTPERARLVVRPVARPPVPPSPAAEPADLPAEPVAAVPVGVP